jgi:hypothetical protein
MMFAEACVTIFPSERGVMCNSMGTLAILIWMLHSSFKTSLVAAHVAFILGMVLVDL